MLKRRSLLRHLKFAVAFGLTLVNPLSTVYAVNSCQAVFSDAKISAVPGSLQLSPEESWKKAIETVRHVTTQVRGSEPYVHAILTAMIAREFVWLNGDPGGAKTLMPTLMFKAALRSIPAKQKRTFILQFHQLLQEGIITGFPKIQEMLKSGSLEVNTKDSLTGDDFLFLIADEAENANPATLASLLSVLNERKAFLGARVVHAILASGVFTSNKTMPDFLDSFEGDRPTGEATADRMLLKLNVVNQRANPAEKTRMYRAVEESRRGGGPEIILPFEMLQGLMTKTQVKPEVFTDMAEVALAFDAVVTEKADSIDARRRGGDTEVASYFPANQFSNRSMLKSPAALKAAHIADQLMAGKSLSEIDFEISRNDLHLLAGAYAYGSASRVRPRRLALEKIQGEDGGVFQIGLTAEWDPYNDRLYVLNPISGHRTTMALNRATKEFRTLDKDSGSPLVIDTVGLADILSKMEVSAQIDRATIEFELDGALDAFLAKKTVTAETRAELESTKEDVGRLIQLMNAQLVKAPRSIDTSARRKEKFKAITTRALALKKKMRAARRDPEALKRLYYEGNREAYHELLAKFPDMAHYIKAMFSSLAASNHVFAFGPPGGAKTLVAKLVLDAEVKSVNQEQWLDFTRTFLKDLGQRDRGALTQLLDNVRRRDPKRFTRFFLQFHKLLPEGYITGVSKLQNQIDNGRTEYNYEDSIIAKKVVVALLDETDKGNPAVLSSLLSVLAERSVMNGAEVFKGSLITAVLTSNKLPGEIVKAFGTNRKKAFALFDRLMNKVYLSNKITDPVKLAQLMYDVDQGLSLKLENPMGLSVMRPLVNEVRISDEIMNLLGKIHEDFTALGLDRQEKSFNAHAKDPNAYPDLDMAASTPSDRTFVGLMDQFKARLLIEQMLKGVPYDQLRKEANVEDVALFFEGLSYWGPQEIQTSYTSDGILHLAVADNGLNALSNSPNVNRRNKAVLTSMKLEADQFVQISNEAINEFTVDMRDAIATTPNLYPALFSTHEARSEWLKKHGGRH